MKYNDSDFEKYLSGKMTVEEKGKFKADLVISPELSRDFNKYKKLKELIDETRSINLNQSYSSNILPRFRNKLEARDKFKFSQKVGAFVTAAASIVIGFFLTLNLLINENSGDNILANIIENEKDSIISSFEISEKSISKADSESLARMDSIYKDALAENISIRYELDEINSNAIDFEDIDFEQYISEEEIDQIYASLINKDIL